MKNNSFFIHSPCFWQDGAGKKLDISFIPPLARRRMSELEKISLFLAFQSKPEYCDYHSVFASQFGEWKQSLKLIQQLYYDNEISPSGFSTSVHNASAGMASIYNNNKDSYTAVAANEDTLEMGILETLVTNQNVLFVFSEESTPEFYNEVIDKPFLGFGLSFFLSKDEPSPFKVEVQFNYDEQQSACEFNKFKDFIENGTELKSKYWSIKRV